MKILTINCSNREFSTGQVKASIENALKSHGCIFYHCYEYDRAPQKKNGYEFLLSPSWLELHLSYYISQLVGLQYGTGSLATIRLISIIKKVKPDIVHIHCPNSMTVNLFKVLNYIKNNHYPTVITNHAEFFFTGNCPHAFECKGYLTGCKKCEDYRKNGRSLFFNRLNESWKKMKDALGDFDKLCMVAVSPWQLERMKSSTIAKTLDCRCILNGIDTDAYFHYTGSDNEWNERYGKYILHVTSSFSEKKEDPKGGYYIFRLAQELYDSGIKYKIIVAGTNRVSSGITIPQNVVVLGEIKDKKLLAELYSGAELTVMVSKRETFGLSCAESLCCGTPVVGFKNGGSESIAMDDYADFLEFGNVEELADKVIEKLNIDVDKERLSEVARQKYSNEVMANEYYKLYEEMVKEI